MLKKDLVNNVTSNMEGLLKKDVAHAVDIILDNISEALAEGRRAEIRGFGSFSVRQRKARSTKNPRTGKIMDIPAPIIAQIIPVIRNCFAIIL